MSKTGRENILKKIGLALTQSTPIPFPGIPAGAAHFQPAEGSLAEMFTDRFQQLQGKLLSCKDESDAAAQLRELCAHRGWTKVFSSLETWSKHLPGGMLTQDIVTCDAAVTGCEILVARTGSMVLSSLNGGRITSAYAPVHICIAYASQLVFDIRDALAFLKEKYSDEFPSFISFATGPSRTADIEKTLVVGVHGPGEVYCFLIDDPI